MSGTTYFLDGYLFDTKEEYNIALREKKNVASIKNKMDMNNKESVLLIYKKIASRQLLISPIGIAFLVELRTHLIHDFQVEPSELPMIHVPSRNGSALDRSKNFTNEQLLGNIRRKEKTITNLKIIIAGLVIAIVSMFVITIKSDNLGFLNTENKILNKYSSWEEELNEREQKIKDKEQSLGISEEEQ